MKDQISNTIPLCPSAQPDWANAIIIGVVSGSVEEPRVAYLDEPIPVNDELMAMTGPVKPTEVFRIAGCCVESKCVHFSHAKCQLVARTVAILPVVTDGLPICRIRASCRWFMQEGRAACIRCPQVITENFIPTEQLVQVVSADSDLEGEITSTSNISTPKHF